MIAVKEMVRDVSGTISWVLLWSTLKKFVRTVLYLRGESSDFGVERLMTRGTIND